MGQTRVLDVSRERNGGFHVTTSRGPIKARDVVIATCGYSDAGVPWMQRRIVPVKLFQAATVPLPAALLNKLIPNGRTLLDSKNNIYWVRLSPDNTRLIVGGRSGMEDGGLEGKARKLHAILAEIFPELAHVTFTHCWEGQTGFSFDKLPHMGIHNGMHYAMGYCGVGLPMGTYLGTKLAWKLLGKSDGDTPFDGRTFPTRPLYNGDPWFLPLMIGYYNTRDRIDQWRG
jgi:glycine/D-amino acid oxidase-like deaminating enzyme